MALRKYVYQYISQAPLHGPTPVSVWAAQTGLMGLLKKKKRHEVKRKSMGMGWIWEEWGINIMKVHCVKSHSTNESIILKNPLVSLYNPVF